MDGVVECEITEVAEVLSSALLELLETRRNFSSSIDCLDMM
jgi:hypothetical protein